MDNEKMGAEFEREMAHRFYRYDKDGGGDYTSKETYQAYHDFKKAWKAAKQPISAEVVRKCVFAFVKEQSAQMGERFDWQMFEDLLAENDSCYDDETGQIKAVIRALGHKIEGEV